MEKEPTRHLRKRGKNAMKAAPIQRIKGGEKTYKR